jgi:hypothetical protein
MTAPRVRLDEAATDFEREMLDSWQGERPPARARQRALALMGTGAAVGATSASAATGAVGGAFVQGAGPKAATLGLLALAKWVAAGSVVAAGVVSVAPFVRQGEAGRSRVAALAPVAAVHPVVAPPARVAVPPPVEEALAPPSEPAVAVVSSPSPQVVAVRSVVVAPQSRPSAAQTQPVAVVAPPPPIAEAAPSVSAGTLAPPAESHPSRALGDQVASLDRARAALAAGDATGAVQAIDVYDARFPNGMLAQEAAVLRIDALARLGRAGEAAELGQRFVAAHPASPYAAKVRQSLAGLTGASNP